MPAEVAEQAFEPFFTTQRGGGSSGLGLSIVYNLVTQRLGGRVRLETTPDAGVGFFVEFPRRRTGASGKGRAALRTSPAAPLAGDGSCVSGRMPAAGGFPAMRPRRLIDRRVQRRDRVFP
jgi:hypothetical protein